MLKTIETKVIAAAAGSGAGAAVGGFVIWLLGVLVWHAPDSAGATEKAVASVPSPVAVLVTLALSVIGAAIAGYQAPHTDRTATVSAPASDTSPAATVATDTPANDVLPDISSQEVTPNQPDNLSVPAA